MAQLAARELSKPSADQHRVLLEADNEQLRQEVKRLRATAARLELSQEILRKKLQELERPKADRNDTLAASR
jgi:hypothetical protein